MPVNCDHLKQLIREVPDFPKKGILFYDITTLLKDKVGFATLIDALSEHYLNEKVDTVLAIEARGFICSTARGQRSVTTLSEGNARPRPLAPRRSAARAASSRSPTTACPTGQLDVLDILRRPRRSGRAALRLMSVGSRIFYQTHLFRSSGCSSAPRNLPGVSHRPRRGFGMLLNAVRRERDGEWG